MKLGTTNIVTSLVYQPFGLLKSGLFQNGEAISRTFDLDGRMTQNSFGTLGFDAAGRIKTAYGNSYDYDNLDRLTRYNDGTTLHTYTLDANGNRTQQTVGNATNTIDPASNKLNAISAGPITKTYIHDANGNITSDGTLTFVYNPAMRLIQAKQGTTIKADYTINGLGQRVKKVIGTNATFYVPDEDGKLLGEYSNGGTLIQEMVWLNDMPIATIRGSTVYYVHTDHLNTP